MRALTIAVATACLGVLGVNGCGNPAHSCGTGDYAIERQHGFATPRQALRSVLRMNPSISQDRWRAASRAARAVEFRSGADSVDIVQKSDGKWAVGGVTNCQ